MNKVENIFYFNGCLLWQAKNVKENSSAAFNIDKELEAAIERISDKATTAAAS